MHQLFRLCNESQDAKIIRLTTADGNLFQAGDLAERFGSGRPFVTIGDVKRSGSRAGQAHTDCGA
jgi:hypothetical protein